MNEHHGEIKVSLSNPAKILRAYMRCSGVTDAKQLAAELDIPIRTIQRLKLECAFVVDGNAKCAIYGAGVADGSANSAIYGAPQPPNTPDMALAQDLHSRAGATKELPTEVLISKIDSPLIAPKALETALPEAIPSTSRKPSKRGTRLDPDWQLPDDWRQWARTIFPASTDASVSEQAAIFRDYWISKPGAQACKLDWEATWRNWCRKGLSAAGNVRQPQHTGSWKPQGPSLIERLRARAVECEPVVEYAA